MAKLKRIGVLIVIMGLSLFAGIFVRDSPSLSSAQSETIIIPPSAYYALSLPSYYRTEEVDINVITLNGSVTCLILINESNLTDAVEHFSSEQTFTAIGNKSTEFVAWYGIITLIIFNPTSRDLTVECIFRSKSIDYGVFALASSLVITGIAAFSLSYVWTSKNDDNHF